MATVDTMNGTKLLIQPGDGADPEVFANDCMINSERGIAFQVDTNEFIVPDCDNPSDPAWKEVTKDGLSATISGSGLLHTTSTEEWFGWLAQEDPRNIRIVIGVDVAKGGGYFEGSFHLVSFEITGNRGEKSQVSLSLVSTGVITWTDAT
ncbi:MAG: hypothetical protein JKY94_07955 [Rhodobacteraceae bacterium]|nr:hypothetical protein [Paracoccaceae bacterium]